MDAPHRYTRRARVALAFMAGWLTLGLWQAYGPWLIDEIRTHVA
jgi:hypothetical protein